VHFCSMAPSARCAHSQAAGAHRGQRTRLGGGTADPNGVSPGCRRGPSVAARTSPCGVRSMSCPLRPRGSPSARQCQRLRRPGAGRGSGGLDAGVILSPGNCQQSSNRFFISLLSASPLAPLLLLWLFSPDATDSSPSWTPFPEAGASHPVG